MSTAPASWEGLQPATGEELHSAIALANSGLETPCQLTDQLATPDLAVQWMVRHGLAAPDAEIQEYCHNRLRTFRSAVGVVMAAATAGGHPEAEALRAVNDALTANPVQSLLGWSEARGFEEVQVHPSTQAVEHAIHLVALDMVHLLTGPDGRILARCQDPRCQRFMLRTHARRQWCCNRCGDRIRAARAYSRRVRGAG